MYNLWQTWFLINNLYGLSYVAGHILTWCYIKAPSCQLTSMIDSNSRLMQEVTTQWALTTPFTSNQTLYKGDSLYFNAGSIASMTDLSLFDQLQSSKICCFSHQESVTLSEYGDSLRQMPFPLWNISRMNSCLHQIHRMAWKLLLWGCKVRCCQ